MEKMKCHRQPGKTRASMLEGQPQAEQKSEELRRWMQEIPCAQEWLREPGRATEVWNLAVGHKIIPFHPMGNYCKELFKIKQTSFHNHSLV
jgi:hypothetical protein